jgi:hypothetical protein
MNESVVQASGVGLFVGLLVLAGFFAIAGLLGAALGAMSERYRGIDHDDASDFPRVK